VIYLLISGATIFESTFDKGNPKTTQTETLRAEPTNTPAPLAGNTGPRIVGLVDEQTCYLESLKEVMGGYRALPTHH
jgi:hypothetical protein